MMVGSHAATTAATLGRNSHNVKRTEGFAAVVLDCDSTLAAIEGIDVLAGKHAAAIRSMTDAAMEGAVPLEEVYGRRLELIRPSREAVRGLGDAYVEALVPGARDTLAALGWLGKHIRILSGGLRPPVQALADVLGIKPEHVAAVDVWFNPDGSFRDFERANPLARAGGKSEVVRTWNLPGPVLLVGDGATDLEARPAVDAFAAFTGVIRRPEVAAGADVTLTEFTGVLALAADAGDRERLQASQWADLLARGDQVLELV